VRGLGLNECDVTRIHENDFADIFSGNANVISRQLPFTVMSVPIALLRTFTSEE